MSLGAIPINDGKMIPYLIRGLYRPGIRSVLMGNTPVTINAFLTELRRLELISESPSDSAVAPSDPSSSMSDNDSNSLSLATKPLTNQVAYLTRNEKQPAELETKSNVIAAAGSDISQGIVLILTLAGKNPIRKMCKPPVGAGAAVNMKKVLEPINLALIEVHVARVGPMKAMVNTRAMYAMFEQSNFHIR
ncbi:hypothetical protein OUZ56_010351 [Daphnia magna]|uniref:Uncharacterized protein n=1 Tax=Daphnia magna TaxID=35525 RepID=A0ABR0AIC2_9CRUS|nr:hypothetical protein OUZ56_010351 [Daphnia magna]